MKPKLQHIVLSFFILLAVLPATSRAQAPVDKNDEADKWWQAWADTNRDGSLDDQELQAWKNLEKERIDSNKDGQIDDNEKRLVWKLLPAPITTEQERKFDADESGWLDPDEARKLLFRRVEFIFETNCKGAIKTGLEEFYDSNQDGVIDLEEVKILREDLR